MILYDGDIPSPNVIVPRLFVHERGGLTFEARIVALSTLENRGERYLQEVNPRGELPALRLDDGRVITEITAICEYLDEIAVGGTSLIGDDAATRAETRMWMRRVDLEIAEPLVAWWRGGKDAEAYYAGHRLLPAESQADHRRSTELSLARLDDELSGRNYIGGIRPMLPDLLLFGFMSTMAAVVPWADQPASRPRVSSWLTRMTRRPAAALALTSLRGVVSLPLILS